MSLTTFAAVLVFAALALVAIVLAFLFCAIVIVRTGDPSELRGVFARRGAR